MTAATLVWLILAQTLEATVAAPVDPAETFVRANDAYESGDFAAAVERYGRLAADQEAGWAVHYNLGNSRLRQGELGAAIASYLRARRRAPRNQDVMANLVYARASARDALAPPEPSPLVRTLFFWHYAFDRGELLRGLIACNAVLWILVSWRLFRPGSEALTWCCCAALALVLAAGASLGVHALAPRRIGVVLPPEIEARSSYTTVSVVRFKLHAGSEVRLEEVVDGWARVTLPDGEGGWVEAEHIEIVEV